MRFNAAKYYNVRVSRARDPYIFKNYSLTGQVLEDVMTAKNVQITFSNDLEWYNILKT